jgi:hypothetical protein
LHGLIFHAFRSFLASGYGSTTDPIWVEAGSYDVTQAHPDEDFAALVERAAVATGLPPGELLRRFGEFAAMRTFADLYPDYYRESRGARSFLLSVEDHIHALVRRAVPDAHPPRLHAMPLGDRGVAITYTSERKLCDLLEGLVRGTARFYGEEVTIEHPQCLLRGDVACAFFVDIQPGAAAASE